ncbi:hypothetical protein Q9L42_018115 [Methylomarinum sp. Ch1-1]|uniref:Endonuclease/exonuclease/phosphatase domain-containing protein n=1 Tax=Methylomarinum roseum TaxID=3067653 RepID=A0AAU7NTE9_9GAMM|nr:hypothetical protein [Methylomarinum sp. Ch1-1]MDP4519723.1 hypothetical protein [Methylomarinum sp. Ch1-1]
MKSLTRLSLCLSLLLASYQALATDDIEVVTLNQYLGADLTPVLNADPQSFNEALVNVLQQIAANDFRARAVEQAQMLAKRSPHMIGLQEVWAFGCVDLDAPEPGRGCDDSSIANAFVDHLQLTLAELHNNGANYQAAAVVNNLDLGKVAVPGLPLSGIPFNVNGANALLIAVDRDVILARQDVQASAVDWSAYQAYGLCAKPSADGCNYQVVASAETPAGTLAVERGFVAVDAVIGNKDYRIFNTHLEVKGEDVGEPAFTFYQAAQAHELLETIELLGIIDDMSSERSLLVLGDMNSSPQQQDVLGPFPAPFDSGIVTTPYHQFIDSAFHDIWELRPGAIPGYSCCQVQDLDSQQALLNERIDMIFVWDRPDRVKQVRVLGDKVSAKTNPPGLGLWPSDHGGVAALLQYD